jgi:phospho-N-acetylmuramoyl-pentapeptide-transferase
MSEILHVGFLFLSLAVSLVAIIPFINILYKIKFKRAKQETRDVFGRLTPIFDKFHAHKAGTPVGGGILVIAVVSILFLLAFPLLNLFGFQINYNYAQNPDAEIFVLLFAFLGFGILGLYDDIKKFFGVKKTGFFGFRMLQKLSIQIILAAIIAFVLYFVLEIDFINIPLFDQPLRLGWLYLPFAVFMIVAFTNAVNITDGLDGLAGGTLLLSLFGLWIISFSILDLPLAIFIALFIGSLISFLYFNVYPARIFLGDVGALSFGATLAVIGLLLGKPIALVVIGFIFVIEVASSLLQLLSKKFRRRKLFPATPVHLYLQQKGWAEPKIVQRFWLLQIIFTLFGIWLTLL